jgi:tetratricopeptide (TPR) repeat protein
MKRCCGVLVTVIWLTTTSLANAGDVPLLELYVGVSEDVGGWQQKTIDDAVLMLSRVGVQLDNQMADNYTRTGSAPKLFAVFETTDASSLLTLDIYNPHLMPSNVLYEQVDQPLSLNIPPGNQNDWEQLLPGLGFYAVNRCSDALAAWSDVEWVWLNFYRGNCALLAEDYETAANTYISLLDSAEDERLLLSNVRVNLAWTYLRQGETERAFETVHNAITIAADACCSSTDLQLAADYARLIADRGQLHALNFDFDVAIADATQAIELASEYELPDALNAQFYKERGDHIFLIYEWDRVLADYDRAIELKPDYADAYYARGVLYYTQGPRAAALADFERFVELAPNDPRVAEAQTYINSIAVELEALDGDDTGPFDPATD